MDDYLNELFGDSEPKEEQAVPAKEPAPQSAEEETAQPVIPAEEETESSAAEEAIIETEETEAPAEAEPEITEEAAKPELAEKEAPVIASEPEAPAEPSIPQAPPVSEPVYQQPYQQSGQYQYVPPVRQGSYFEPSYQQPTAYYQPPYQPMPGGTYFTPVKGETPTPSAPASVPQTEQNAPAPKQDGAAPEVQEAPKSKRKTGIIIAIIALICVVIAGVGIATAGNTGKSDGGSSIFDFSGESSSEETEDNSDAEVEVKSSDEAAKTDDSGNLTAAGVVEKVKSSCVGVTVYTEQSAYNYFYNYGQGSSGNGNVASGEGSGIIMSEANGKTYIMTCAHVISDGSSFTVTLDDDTEYDATLVGYDSQTDIGVLSIQATGLSVAEFGDSEDIEVGEACVAIGCPGGLTFKNSVTQGIVSALDVPVSSSIGYKNQCIQVDAAINPGNSGGALFNMQGQVIGINSSKIASTEYEGMGFAVPSNTATATANSLIKNGYVEGRAVIGIKYNSLSAFTSANSILSALNEKGYENAAGTMVIQEIQEDSDLYGKVQQYDMIIAANGQTMTSTDVLTSILADSKPGDTVKLTIARINNNKIDTFEVECKLIESKK